MLRKQYQEKFMKKELAKHENIKNIEKEIDEVFYLFEELYQTTSSSQKSLNTIEENIVQTSQNIQDSTDELYEATKEQETYNNYKYFTYMLVGGGLGTVGLAFNTYIGIGSVVGGCMLGSLFTILNNLNS